MIIKNVENMMLSVGMNFCLNDVMFFCFLERNLVRNVIIVSFINFEGCMLNVLILI